MSLRRQLDRLRQQHVPDNKLARQIAAELSAMSDQELMQLADQMAADIRAGRLPPPMAARDEPRNPDLAHLSDDELIESVRELDRIIEEKEKGRRS